MQAIGERIRSLMTPDLNQRQLAEQVEMTPDALSRALNGQRGFASVELAKIADALGADVYWLITGNPDPFRVDVAARHGWDSAQSQRVNPGREADHQIIGSVVRAYREAYPDGPPASVGLPESPAEVRSLLGAGFVRPFASAVEQRLGVDVVRVQKLSTDYSMRIGGRGIILLASTPNWFRSNWSLAHEIGHLAQGHHQASRDVAKNELAANRFAASLLLPDSLVRGIDWDSIGSREMAVRLWDLGVSTEALRNRLSTLQIAVPQAVAALLREPTQRLIRRHTSSLPLVGPWGDPVTDRERASATRMFPLGLLTALRDRVADGAADPQVLAWVLEVPIDELAFPEPDELAEAAAYEAMLADRTIVLEWADVLRTSEPRT